MPKVNDQFWQGQESVYVSRNSGNTGPAPAGGRKKRILQILFIVDISGSMEGPRIAQVNRALETVFAKLRRRNDLHCGIRIGIMTFSDTAKWLTPRPVPLEEYRLTRIEAAPWYTCYSRAFRALEEKLHSTAFMDPKTGDYLPPLILFISDGEPVDKEDYPQSLEMLKRNHWFQRAAKYAVAVGEESRDQAVIRTLAQFAGPIENVRYAGGGDSLSQVVEHIAIHAAEAQVSDALTGREDLTGEKSIFRRRDETLFKTMFDTEK